MKFSPSFSVRFNLDGKQEPEYLGMHPDGGLFLVAAKDLAGKEPHQFVRTLTHGEATLLTSASLKSNRLVKIHNGVRCEKFKFRSDGKKFKMFSACDANRSIIRWNTEFDRVGIDEANIEFESNWFTGLQFFVMFKDSDGSIKVLLTKADRRRFKTATIDGKLLDTNAEKPLEPMLKLNNLYRDNVDRYHLNVAGGKGGEEEFCFDGYGQNGSALRTKRGVSELGILLNPI